MQKGYISSYTTVLDASVEAVWCALTEPVLVKKYLFGSLLETDWKPGSPIVWKGEFQGQAFIDKGEVLEYEMNSKLSYSYLSSWAKLDDKPENYLLVGYEVKKVSGGTELTITQTNYDEEKKAHSSSMWETVVDGLKKVIA